MSYGDSSAETEDARLMEHGTVTVSSLGDFRQAMQEARADERAAMLQAIDEEIQGYESLPSLGATSNMQYQYLRGCVEGLRIARNSIRHLSSAPCIAAAIRARGNR